MKNWYGWAAGLALGACGGGTPEPAAPDDTTVLEDSGSETPAAEPASSAKVQEGIDAIQAGDFEGARAILTEAHEAKPEDAQAAFYLGVALEGLKEIDGALGAYEKALKADPKLVDAYVNLSGILLDAKNDAAAALEAVKKGLAIDPKRKELLVNRALALEVTGGEGLADAYRAAVDASPDDATLRLAFADVLVKAGDKKGATEQLESIGRSTDAKLAIAASRLLGRIGEFDRCTAILDRLVEKAPTGELHMFRALCRNGKEKFGKGAEEDLKKAIELTPDLGPAHYYLGMHLCGTKRAKDGVAALKKAAEIGADQGVKDKATQAIKSCK